MLGTGPLLGHAVQLLKRLQSYAVMAMVSHGYSLSFVSAIKRPSVQASWFLFFRFSLTKFVEQARCLGTRKFYNIKRVWPGKVTE